MRDEAKPPIRALRTQTEVVADSTAVAKVSDIVILMVPDTPDVANVLFADDGVA
ncbi:2-hydroxy-3-oxopropionate reductase, partial [Paraburkholderia sp. BR10937]